MMAFGGEPKVARKTAKDARQLAPDSGDFLTAIGRIEKHPQRAQLASILLDSAEGVVEADGKVVAAEEVWKGMVFGTLDEMVA